MIGGMLNGVDFKLSGLWVRECPNDPLFHDSIPSLRLSQLGPIPTETMRQPFEDMNIRGYTVINSCQPFQ